MTGAHGQWAWLGFRKALKWPELVRLQILRPDLDYKKYGNHLELLTLLFLRQGKPITVSM